MNRLQMLRNSLAERKNILIVGSGLMAETLIDHLLLRPENHITIGSLILSEAQSLASKRQRCTAVHLDVMNDSATLHNLVREAHITIPYVPPTFIIPIARACLKEGRHMITANYLSPEVAAMNDEAKRKGILMLNEMGLDPGIDHLATYRVLEHVKAQGGKILEYESWCGGLPAPENCDNPFGYKFSWSPIAAIRNVNNDGRYLEDGKEVYLPSTHLLYARKLIKINPAFILEGYPNRNSVPYKSFYGLDDCTKVLRGTLRYQGFSVIMSALRTLGLVADDKLPYQQISFYNYLQLVVKDMSDQPRRVADEILNKLVEETHTTRKPEETRVLLAKIFNKILAHDYYSAKSKAEVDEDVRMIFEAMDWLRLFDESVKTTPGSTHVENLVAVMQGRLVYQPGETDLVVMQHIFKVQYPNKPHIKTIKSTLVMTGDKNGKTAMAKTVSTPVAIVAQLVLDGVIKTRGVHLPMVGEINNPIIVELEKLGLMCKDEEE